MCTIVLYGNSLAVSSVGASLQDRAGLNIVPVNYGLTEPASELNALEPDILIFDLSVTQPSFAMALLRLRPGLLLIGVDLMTSKALVLSSRTSSALTTEDLVQVIESHIGGPEKEIA